MITIQYAFWILVVLFAMIGAMRGWAKELLVTFSVLVGLFIIALLTRFAPSSLRSFLLSGSTTTFWIYTSIILFLAFFGYQTPTLARFAQGRFVREKFSDALLGLFLGALNGWLIIGSIWFFMAMADYPFTPNITAPPTDLVIMNYLPPELLIANNSATIYFAVAVSFLFVLVVFI
jgi:uncharacterized membrane protein required for colicin V production